MNIMHEILKRVRTKISHSQIKNKLPNDIYLRLSIIIISLGFLAWFFGFMIFLDSKTDKDYSKAELKSLFYNQASRLGKDKTRKGIVLNGIITMDGEYLALVNNEILKVGDYIQKYRIISITDKEVDLLLNDRITTLEIE